MTHPPSILGTSLYSRASLRGGPRLATRQVRGRHRIMVIRETGAPQNEIDHADGSCLRMTVKRKRESPRPPGTSWRRVNIRAPSTEHVRWPGAKRVGRQDRVADDRASGVDTRAGI